MTRAQWTVAVLGIFALGSNLLVTRDFTGEWQQATTLFAYFPPDLFSRMGTTLLAVLGLLWMTTVGKNALSLVQRLVLTIGIAGILYTAYSFHLNTFTMSSTVWNIASSQTYYPAMAFFTINIAAYVILLIAIIGVGIKPPPPWKINVVVWWIVGFLFSVCNATIDFSLPLKYLIITGGIGLYRYYRFCQHPHYPPPKPPRPPKQPNRLWGIIRGELSLRGPR